MIQNPDAVPPPGSRSRRHEPANAGNQLPWAFQPVHDTAASDAPIASRNRFLLDERVAQAQEAHFGVERSQIEHDFVISHVLAVLAAHRHLFVFHGGTALSRTFLNGLRLSEDIDLLATTGRAQAAATLDAALRRGLQRGFGSISATPSLTGASRDTQPCVYRIGPVRVQIQLINGLDYPSWPRQQTMVDLRYPGLDHPTLTTYTAEGFAAAKTAAWCDQTRNAPATCTTCGHWRGAGTSPRNQPPCSSASARPPDTRGGGCSPPQPRATASGTTRWDTSASPRSAPRKPTKQCGTPGPPPSPRQNEEHSGVRRLSARAHR